MANWFPWRKKELKTREVREPLASREAPLQAVKETVARSQEDSQPVVAEMKQSYWRRGLALLRRSLILPLDRVFRGRPFSEELLIELEDVLLAADIGVGVVGSLISRLQARCRRERPTDAEQLKTYLKDEMLALLQKVSIPPLLGEAKPWVILMIGVNGVGKTTTIAKLAARFRREGKSVLLVAADTFRAAALEHLEVWAEQLQVDIVKHRSGASPAAVAYDGIQAARARRIDVVIVDTAGRLHTKTPLIEELKKVQRVIAKELPEAPHHILLVLDAVTGQNALNQAQVFQNALPVTGVVVAKMDGSAKGGMIFSIVEKLGLPIVSLGLGEREEDLQDFTAEDFVEALFAVGEAPEGALSLDRYRNEY
jgi:fused signal recognition particle receptor